MTKEEIRKILEKYYIFDYTINDDLTVDVNKSISFLNCDLIEIPLKFGKVRGFFDCSHNNLKTLVGAPNYVSGAFYVHDNPHLENLNGIPLNIKEDHLHLPHNFTYNDYLDYSNRVKRDSKFKKILK